MLAADLSPLRSCPAVPARRGVAALPRRRHARSRASKASPSTASPTACTVLLFPDATKPTMTVNVTYLVGSRTRATARPAWRTCSSTCCSRARRRSRACSPSSAGAACSSTAPRRTTARTTSRRSPRRTPILDWALKLEADRMTRSTFSKAELDTEMTVVRNEFESGENKPQSVLWKRMAAVAFDWHNYGKSTIGARSDIENVPIEQPAGVLPQVLPARQRGADVAGKFDADATLAPIAKYFGADPEADARAADALHRRAGAGRRAHGDRAPRRAARNGSARCSTCRRARNPDATAFEALADIMTVEPAGRLYKALVEGKKASSRRELDVPAARPGLRDLLGAGAARRVARRRARHDARDAVRRRRASDHRRRSSSACAPRR